VKSLLRSLNPWVWVGAVAVAVLVCGLSAAVGLGMRHRATLAPTVVPQVVLIPLPTATLRPILQTAAAPTETAVPVLEDGIAVGMYVQITGTGGEGLRLRSGPGVGQPPLFLGMDAEVFEVRDGPRSADGYTWWYLTAPYDEKRSGWAAANYLTVVAQQP